MATLMQDYAPLAVLAQEQVKVFFCQVYMPYTMKIYKNVNENWSWWNE